jgi:hypothetical protein
MLQGFNKLLQKCLMLLALISCFGACRSDSSGSSDEKAIYLEDYISPENLWGFIDTIGQLVIAPEYDEVAGFSEQKASVNKAGLWGYINIDGKEIIKPQFREAYAFHENLARVKPFDSPACYVSSTGKILSSDQWSAAGDFSEGFALAKEGASFGFIDTSGRMIIEAVYSRAWNFDHGIAIIEIKGKQGVIDKNGKMVIPPNYDHVIHTASSNLLLGNSGSTSMIWHLDGSFVDSIQIAKAKETDGTLVSISMKGKMQLYSLESKTLVNDSFYSQLFYLGEHRWCVKTDSLYHLMDENGKLIGNKGYNQINKFSDHIAAYKLGDGWGYIDVNGIGLTEPILGLAWDYKNGFARASFKDGLTFIDSKQQIAFYPPTGCLDMRDFDEGLAPVQLLK